MYALHVVSKSGVSIFAAVFRDHRISSSRCHIRLAIDATTIRTRSVALEDNPVDIAIRFVRTEQDRRAPVLGTFAPVPLVLLRSEWVGLYGDDGKYACPPWWFHDVYSTLRAMNIKTLSEVVERQPLTKRIAAMKERVRLRSVAVEETSEDEPVEEPSAAHVVRAPRFRFVKE